VPNGRGGNGYDAPPLDPNNGRRPPPRSNTSPLPYADGPPSPEFSNLDCAFPPFVDSRSATPTLGSPSHPDMDNDYVRMHAEPNLYGSRSPRRENEGLMQRMDTMNDGPFAMAGREQNQGMSSRPQRRSASIGGRRPSFGQPSRQQEQFERPSTAGPGSQRKQSIPGFNGVPRRNDNVPPMPPGPGQGRPLQRNDGGYGFMGQPGPRDFPDRGRQPSPPRQGPKGGNYGFGPGPTNDRIQDRGPPFNKPGAAPGQPAQGWGGLGPDPSQTFLDSIPPPSRIDGPYGSVGRQPDPMRQPNPRLGLPPNDNRQGPRPGNDQYGTGPGPQSFNPMPSPTRSQTFPRRDDGRSGPMAPLPRRPSEPSPSGRRRTPSASSRNGPPNQYMPYQAGDKDPTSRPGTNGPYPPRGQSRNGMRDDMGAYPPRGQSRNGMRNDAPFENGFPPRGPSRTGGRGDYGVVDESQNPYPPRTASRNDVRGRQRGLTNQFPPRGPSQNSAREGSLVSGSRTREGSLVNGSRAREGSLGSGSRTRRPGDYSVDSGKPLPILNTANDYDVGDPYHTQTDSASSNASSVSVAQSMASSRSSPPLSETSYQPRRKGSDTSRLNDLMDEYDPYQAKNSYNNKASGVKSEAPRPGFYHQMPDSPTDPAFQQGRLSPISATPERDTLAPLAQKPKPSQPSRRPTATNKGNCRGCGDKITGKSVSSADGRLTGRYHKECFVCKTCSEPFATTDFYVIKNHPYCSQHYHALNGTLCKTCDRGIEGQYLETESKQKFHPTCFTCTVCTTLYQRDIGT
jgi:hypothetical protein